MSAGRVLLTGATGYVGGRLLPLLEKRGERVRCLARRPGMLTARVAPGTEVVEGDLLQPGSLGAAMTGVQTAYYLVHSMGSQQDFEEEDRAAARAFADAARAAGVRRIVYLGGLGEGEKLSPHLASRQEVGRILAGSGAQVVEFRASIVIGSGSISYEMVRALVERLPVMTTPSWVRVQAQPIAVEDLLAYLLAALDLPEGPSVVYEIGGRDKVTYEEIMREYARQRGLKRVMVPVALLTPWLSSLWLAFITPIYARIGRRLFTSLVHETVVRDDRALRDFPIKPRGLVDSITRALRNEDREYAESRWFDALSSNGALRHFPGASARIVDSRSADSAAPPARLFEEVASLGGSNGWPFQWLWALRGSIDLLVGGVGIRRGRPSGRGLRAGDALDFWRVDVFEPGRRLRLHAEMRLPGRAWLEFEVTARGDGSRLNQTAVFEPLGLAGLLYWYALVPLHAVIFTRMADALARRAENPSNERGNGGVNMSELSTKNCQACDGKVPPLTRSQALRFLEEVPGWTLNNAGHIEKTYEHEGFRRGLEFVKKVGEMCEEQGHHGDLHLAWGKTRLEVWTHKINGLVEADFIWAAKADKLWSELP